MIGPVIWHIYRWTIIIMSALLFLQLFFIWKLWSNRRRLVRSQSDRGIGEERFRVMVESMPNALVMVNHKGTITLVNSRAESLFGYPRHEMIGMLLEQLIPTVFRDEHFKQRKDFLHRPETWSIGAGRDLSCVRRDGREVPVEIGLNPVKTREGNFVLASIVDISQRRRAEIEAERHRQEITHLSRVDMLSHLSGSLAHELNQPLTSMLTNSQVARRLLDRPSVDIEELKQIVDDVISDNRRAGDIVVRLRGWLKKGGQKLAENNVNTMIEEVVQFLRSEFVLNKVSCSIKFDPALPAVVFDKVQIQQVLVNLLKNAFEANQSEFDRDLHLEISTEMDQDENIVINVMDDGNGLQGPIKDELFNPFVTTKKEGLGIGLSISRTIVENHGGRIWFETNPSRGVTFHFTLPTTKKVVA